MTGIAKNAPGCTCCQPIDLCCTTCDPVFPGPGYTGDLDATFTGFGDSADCDNCDFLNQTFTLQCPTSEYHICLDARLNNLPDDYVPGYTCYWGLIFDGYIGDRLCSIVTTDGPTGYTITKTFGWSGLLLAKYKIDDGVSESTVWRLHIGYLMTVSVTETVLDTEGNPVERGSYARKCDDFYYDFELNSWPSRCNLSVADTFIKTEDIGEISATYPEFAGPFVTGTTSFADWCDDSGSVSVEAEEV